jgi:acetyl-CoA C-acetyltransferase
MAEAFEECLKDAGIEKKQIEAAWQATGVDAFNVGPGAIPLSMALRLPYIPVTRVENYCASGTEAFRGAVYAVASGACDIALALGFEKLKDMGYGGLPQRTRGVTNDMFYPNLSAPGMFAQLAAGYGAKYGIDKHELKRAMAHVSVKSHANGAKNPKAHLRKAITEEQALNAPMIAEPIGLFDCCGVSDGAACAIVATPEIAASLGKKELVSVKALQLSVSNGEEGGYDRWDGSSLQTTRIAAKRAYAEAGIKNPRKEISMTEVHDCFSITEILTMEDLYLSENGSAVKDVLNGVYDADGEVPCQIDGGLKCFGHPIGASGLRMLYEMYLQLHGRAGDRQLPDPVLGLTHNLGGFPHQNVSSVAIIGRYDRSGR